MCRNCYTPGLLTDQAIGARILIFTFFGYKYLNSSHFASCYYVSLTFIQDIAFDFLQFMSIVPIASSSIVPIASSCLSYQSPAIKLGAAGELIQPISSQYQEN